MLSSSLLEQDQPKLIAASASTKDGKADALTGQDLDSEDQADGTGNGLKAEYFDNEDFTDLKLTRTDPTVDFKWGKDSPDKLIGADTFSARWTGQVQPEYSEKYTFHTTSDDGVRLWVDGKKLIDNWAVQAPTENKGSITLDAGNKYDIKLEYYENTLGATEQLSWSTRNQEEQIIPQSQLYSKDTSEGPEPTPVPEPDPKPDPKPPSSGGSKNGTQARSANEFTDSAGVATHLQYGGAYAQFDSIVKPRLEELGIRHIRTGGSSEKVIDRINDLAESGIKTILVADPRNGITPSNVVDVLKKMPNAVDAVEGPNEWDVHPELKYNGKSFPEGLEEYQNDLYKAVKGDPATKDIIVAAPSMAHSINGAKLGRLNSFDKGVMHSYQGGQLPANMLDEKWLPHTKEISGDKPIYVTETGWHNAKNSSRQPGISENVEAKYTPRLYLDNFNEPDIERTYRYEFLNVAKGDTQRENWGLLNNDGSPQPAFNSLKNLLSLTKDSGDKSFTPGKLDYKLSGDTENVKQTLLQKSDGEFNLILWQDAKSYDTKAKKDVAVPDNKVTLELGKSIESAKSYLPYKSTEAIGSYSNTKSIDLSVPDHPLVVKLS